MFLGLTPNDLQAISSSLKASHALPTGNLRILIVKKLVIRGYFNSEIGVTQALNYRPIPGTFKGCIPLKESDGKLWS